MNENTLKLLEFDSIRAMLADHCRTREGKDQMLALTPLTDPAQIRSRLAETDEARRLADARSGAPIHSLTGIGGILLSLKQGGILSAGDLETLNGFVKECARLKRFMTGAGELAPTLQGWSLSLQELTELSESIDRCIIRGEVADQATPVLSKLMKRCGQLEDKIQIRLDALVKNPRLKDSLQDTVISQRNGRYVLALKNAYWRSMPGTARDRSASGSTVFVEPEAVRLLQEELEAVRLEAARERERILAVLSAEAAEAQLALEINRDAVIRFDTTLAKGKLSRQMEGRAAAQRSDDRIVIRNGRHPLLGSGAVPLNYQLPEGIQGLVITGPNTGGKTVVLKTVGLMVAMNQAGLHVPAAEGTALGLFRSVLADIGDGQSLQQNLSTFSSHMKTISGILAEAGPRTLVLLDEMGSGTDPAEGMGLAAAILEALHQSGAMILATTHFVEVKAFAKRRSGFINGAMDFCLETLSPRYRLTIGRAGESHGLHIAEKLGLPGSVIRRARQLAQGSTPAAEVTEDLSAPPADLELQPLPPEATHTEEPLKPAPEVQQQLKALEKQLQQLEAPEPQGFQVGDAVRIPFMSRTGIVVEAADKKGDYAVLVNGKRLRIRGQRMTLYIPGSELYPEDYDLDIVTKSKEYRKKNHQLSKGKRNVVLEHTPEKGS